MLVEEGEREEKKKWVHRNVKLKEQIVESTFRLRNINKLNIFTLVWKSVYLIQT